ncbi:MAG: excinuclease ABC subunit UvrA [Bacteroidales bacterium]|nr:excinuclease ABC subunit UvrA [Bacteroidales bacterium]MCF8351248.1 excinuclease ABC subunit UvrA [Bacteroidales bacterium]MCF8377601.1 excinuclease ABC subunit UvrA [Bacteroidales bacterium]MCF8401890.1 excinuclease ABC subunit UvrA [Bacteroidales bacterium]
MKAENTYIQKDISKEQKLEIFGAREHNLKNINLSIPRNKLVVVTGLSGSGKSSLAFDTIYAEGQRRYMETFSAYARQFIGNLERPDVDQINGLSPVISIEQKSINKNPRSTVGTVTEIYDFMRLLYARAAEAHSWATGEKMIRYSEEQIINLILEEYEGKRIILLAPVVKGRKGHYRELFEQIRKMGYLRIRIDGEIKEISFGMQTDRYRVHDIEIVVDRIVPDKNDRNRISQSVQTALRHGKDSMMVLEEGSTDSRQFSRKLMCPSSGISYDEPEPNTFSFNSPYGACSKCNGLGSISEVDIKKIIPDKSKSIRRGGFAPLGEYKNNWIFQQIEAIGQKYGFTLDSKIKDLPDEAITTILYGSNESFTVKRELLGITSTYTLNFEGIVNFILNQHNESESRGIRRWANNFMNRTTCPECEGSRLKKESRFFLIGGKNIAELANMDIILLSKWFDEVHDQLTEKQKTIGREIIREIKTRIKFLLDVGIDYLVLNRPTRSLSGGEAQRIRLATQIGSQLTNVLYILDEPSIGLHQRDNLKLIRSLKDLRDVGNSVIVVEHDKETILNADHVVDIGPGAGRHGGEIVAQGTPAEMHDCNTLTCDYLSGKKQISVPQKRREGNKMFIRLQGATGHNLKDVSLELPLGKLVCVTGVSGSGKSSLINETLYPILSQHFYKSVKRPLPYKSIDGLKNIDKVIEIDQSPIGRTPRSNPATYTKVFDEIRKLFAQLPEAKIRGYKPGRFSFNVKGGRCETCKGAGLRVIEMNFLPDVYVHCETCNGQRYNRETLEVRYKGKSINDVLNLTINQAVDFFENIPAIIQKIKTLKDVGLGYITLGQSSTTLSGGEAQRVKLAAELSKRDTGKTLYILDEPTTGLHFEDVKVLLDVLDKLVDRGNTVLIIEHNMEVIKVADHIIDLGPEGGERGGEIITTGSPEEIAKVKKSYTGYYLKEELKI